MVPSLLPAVWGCSWHWSGHFLASGGMDHCAKIWDIVRYAIVHLTVPQHSPPLSLPVRGVCVSTLRGHTDSVNAVHFMPYSNSLCSVSADKTLSVWDIRTVCHTSHHLILPYRHVTYHRDCVYTVTVAIRTLVMMSHLT